MALNKCTMCGMSASLLKYCCWLGYDVEKLSSADYGFTFPLQVCGVLTRLWFSSQNDRRMILA